MNKSMSGWNRLLAEMKRRRVFRAIALYGTGVFALLQLVQFLTPSFALSPHFLNVVMLVCVAVFPCAVFSAWTFDFSAYGWHRTHVAASGEIEAILALPRAKRWPAGLLALMGVVLFGWGGWWVATRELEVPAVLPIAAPSAWVAVLPVHNLGPARDDAFSDGLTEDLGRALSQLEGVRVVSPTSVAVYKGRSIDARSIGRELNVGTIVEGSVQRSGHRVRISVTLSRTSDGFRVWGKSWEREVTVANKFAVQDAIALEVAEGLGKRPIRLVRNALH